MLTRITCQDKMLNWQQAIEVKGVVEPCADNREHLIMDRNREFRGLCGST